MSMMRYNIEPPYRGRQGIEQTGVEASRPDGKEFPGGIVIVLPPGTGVKKGGV